MIRVIPGVGLSGTTRVPGDKSVTHRALLFSSIGDGVTEIEHPGTGADNLSTLSAIRQLGVEATFDDAAHFTVRGVGLRGWSTPAEPIDCGNSGTTARLLAGMLAGAGVEATLVGDASLSRRPMRRVADPLGDLGYRVETEASGTMPMRTLAHAGVDDLDEEAAAPMRAVLQVASAQVKSCILLSGLWRTSATEVVEPAPSRDHTERMLRVFGVRVQSSGHYAQPVRWAAHERLPTVVLSPPARPLRAHHLEVPGDPSSAAFLVGAALLSEGEVVVERVGTNPTRTGWLDVLERMGASIRWKKRTALTSGEPAADLSVGGARLSGVVIEGAEVPRVIDEIPLLAVIGAACTGRFEVRDARELRVKESDRIEETVKILRAMGVDVEVSEDGFAFEGLGGTGWAGIEVDGADDHRIAMAAVVAGLGASSPSTVTGTECIAVSYPSFVATLNALGGRLEEDA